MEQATIEHPTREEFERLQKLMPPGMRALLAQHDQAREVERAAKFARAEAKAKELRDLLTAFEIAVDEVIAGNEWMKMFRVTAPAELAANPFGHDHRHWVAVFDFERVGGYRLWVDMPLTSPERFDPLRWRPDLATFTVVNPRANVGAKTLAEAMAQLTAYCAAPF